MKLIMFFLFTGESKTKHFSSFAKERYRFPLKGIISTMGEVGNNGKKVGEEEENNILPRIFGGCLNYPELYFLDVIKVSVCNYNNLKIISARGPLNSLYYLSCFFRLP